MFLIKAKEHDGIKIVRMEESLHSLNVCYFLKSILKLTNIKLEKELKKKQKIERATCQKKSLIKVSNYNLVFIIIKLSFFILIFLKDIFTVA